MQSALDSLLDTLERPIRGGDEVAIRGSHPVLPTPFRIGEAAAAALAAGGLLASDLWQLQTGRTQRVEVKVQDAAASLLSFARLKATTLDPRDALVPRPTVGLYPCRGGQWFHLHGGFPHLRDGLLDLLACSDDADAIGAALAKWDAEELEDAIALRGLCGARVRTHSDWSQHPQGRVLAETPIVEIHRIGDSPPIPVGDTLTNATGSATETATGNAARHARRPLGGVRVLDLTRVLAGPTCARTLAEHGADVLHLRSPNLPFILPFVMDTNHGKRSAYLDLDQRDGVDQLRELVRSADVFSQGYRAGALAKRGFGAQELAELRPGLVYVSINCYGHEGPWRERAGWEQLAQTVTGIAAEQGGSGSPALLPAAATDYTTGYLAAAGVLAALLRRATEGGSYHVRVSLSRTGMWLQSLGRVMDAEAGASVAQFDPRMTKCETVWGTLEHLAPVLEMSETAPRWDRAVAPLGHDPATW